MRSKWQKYYSHSRAIHQMKDVHSEISNISDLWHFFLIIASSFHLIQEKRFFIRSAGLVPLDAATRVCLKWFNSSTFLIYYSKKEKRETIFSIAICIASCAIFWQRLKAQGRHCIWKIFFLELNEMRMLW